MYDLSLEEPLPLWLGRAMTWDVIYLIPKLARELHSDKGSKGVRMWRHNGLQSTHRTKI